MKNKDNEWNSDVFKYNSRKYSVNQLFRQIKYLIYEFMLYIINVIISTLIMWVLIN